VVQTTDNDYYLKHSFYNSYVTSGTVFLDKDASVYDQNIVMYGHNVYMDQSKMFSPLTTLVNQSNYEANKTFKVYYADQIVDYEIFSVYYFDVNDIESFNYTEHNFSSEEAFNEWLEYPLSKNLIVSDASVSYGDNLITLQTCKKYDDDHRVIVLAKETGRTNY